MYIYILTDCFQNPQKKKHMFFISKTYVFLLKFICFFEKIHMFFISLF